MNTEIAIIKKENIEVIVNNAPISYNENVVSNEKCLDAGNTLLCMISESGMTDELDEKAAQYIDRARKTVKKMNDKRSPVTKLFDEIRTTFTSLENAVDPSKKESVPYKIQQYRNEYANKKRQEAEEARQRELIRQQAEAARNKYRNDCVDAFKRSFNNIVSYSINHLTSLNGSITLDNFDTTSKYIVDYNCVLPDDINEKTLGCDAYLPANLNVNEAKTIRTNVFNSLLPKFQKQYTFELESTRDTFVDMLASKKRELEAAAQASHEEAERIKAEIAARDAQEARKKEEARRLKEIEEARQKEIEQQSANVDNLFGAASVSMPSYQPKVQVKQKLVPLNSEAFIAIISMWWNNEGCNLSVDELSKIFKKQIAFCEKMANDKSNPTTIESEHIQYIEDVKAK